MDGSHKLPQPQSPASACIKPECIKLEYAPENVEILDVFKEEEEVILDSHDFYQTMPNEQDQSTYEISFDDDETEFSDIRGDREFMPEKRKKSANTTNKEQLKHMISCMEKNPDIANRYSNCSKEDLKKFWRIVSHELNSMGPPVKHVIEWKKVWMDKKKYVRKKMLENLKHKNATNGAPFREFQFSDLEEAIIKLCAMDESLQESGKKCLRTAEKQMLETNTEVDEQTRDNQLNDIFVLDELESEDEVQHSDTNFNKTNKYQFLNSETHKKNSIEILGKPIVDQLKPSDIFKGKISMTSQRQIDVNVNKEQLKHMISCMEQNPDIARRYSNRNKEDLKKFWRIVSHELNSMGPPVKHVIEWKKVWNDKKKYVRKKMSENFKHRNAANGAYFREFKFSDLEEAIIKICAMGESLQTAEKQKLETNTEADEQTGDNQLNDIFVLDELESDDEVQHSDTNFNKTNKSHFVKPEKHKTNSIEILEKPSVVQMKPLDTFKETTPMSSKRRLDVMEKNIKKIYRSIRTLKGQQKKILNETKRHNLKMEKLKRVELDTKFNFKKRLIEIEEAKLKILELQNNNNILNKSIL